MLLLNFSPLDINECSVTDPPPCDGNATCTNTNGSYFCTCFEEYTGDGFVCTRKNLLEPFFKALLTLHIFGPIT